MTAKLETALPGRTLQLVICVPVLRESRNPSCKIARVCAYVRVASMLLLLTILHPCFVLLEIVSHESVASVDTQLLVDAKN